MSLLPFFEWCENSRLIVAMRGSVWLFPAVESLHLIGLALIGGAVLIVDLRLLGVGLRGQPVARIARDAERWLLLSLGVMMPTGVLLFMASAVKCYYLPVFWVKMTSLALALVFTFGIRRQVAMAPDASRSLIPPKIAAAVSLSLWSCVAISGRLVGFP
jgi:uncharacterized protein DUF6644